MVVKGSALQAIFQHSQLKLKQPCLHSLWCPGCADFSRGGVAAAQCKTLKRAEWPNTPQLRFLKTFETLIWQQDENLDIRLHFWESCYL